MGTTPSRLPTEDEIASAKAYSRELAKYADKSSVRMKLVSDGQSSDDFVLPGHLVELMLRVATEVSMGNGVSILPISAHIGEYSPRTYWLFRKTSGVSAKPLSMS